MPMVACRADRTSFRICSHGEGLGGGSVGQPQHGGAQQGRSRSMGSITATMWITLDGVVQGLGRSDEDTRGGFTHGGWGQQYNDEVMGRELAKAMAKPGDMLFGRRTWQDFITAWGQLTDGNPYTTQMNATTKYVVSKTLASLARPASDTSRRRLVSWSGAPAPVRGETPTGSRTSAAPLPPRSRYGIGISTCALASCSARSGTPCGTAPSWPLHPGSADTRRRRSHDPPGRARRGLGPSPSTARSAVAIVTYDDLTRGRPDAVRVITPVGSTSGDPSMR